MAPHRPSDLELQLLSVLWERGPSTARELLEVMPDGKQRAYTTILSVLQVMEKKGFLKHESRGAAHVYRPAMTREKVLVPMLSGIVRNVFGGSPAAVMQQLLKTAAVDQDELDEIRKLIAEHESKSAAQTRKEGRK